MTSPAPVPNQPSPDFFTDLADQVMAKLDIGTGWRMLALVEQVVNETQDNVTQLQTDPKRNEAEVKAREGEVAALCEVIRALKQHQLKLGPCKSRQDLVDCMIDWATQQLTENQNKRTQLEAQPPKDEQAISACKGEIATLGQLIRAFEQFRERLDPYESKEDNNWKGLVKDIIHWAKEEVQDNEEKLEILHAATPKSEQEISACERKIAVFTGSIVALEKYQIDLDACLKAYVQGQHRNPQDFVTLLTRALEENREAAKQVRRVTIPWPKRIFFFKKALAKKVSVRLQAEFVAQSDQLQKTLSELFPNSAVSKALHAYVVARRELRQGLTAGFKQCLGLAPRIWRGMEWPLPFGLVLYEELTELDRLRTKRREEVHKCLEALPSQDNEEARDARECLLSRLTQYLVEEAKCGKPDNDAKAQARKDAVQALENYINNPQDDTKRALDAVKDVLVEMAIERSFKKVQLSGDGPFNAAGKAELVGLALSGGGIRSATFNLGVLQGLAKRNILPCIDYLSTVSGGGYIGSWLSAWLKRKGLRRVSGQLRPDWRDPGGAEPPEIEFLRSYSNYLTPQLGLFSADTWSLVATWARNVLLNLNILVLMTSALLLVPRFVVHISHGSHPWLFYFVPMLVLVGLAILWTGINFNLFVRHQTVYPRYSKQGVIQLTVVIPMVLASWLGSCWLWNHGQYLCRNWGSSWAWALGGLTIISFIWLVPFLLPLTARSNQTSDRQPAEELHGRSWLSLIITAPLVGALAGLLFYCLAKLYASLSHVGYPGKEIHFVAFGTELVAAIFGLMVALQIGLMGKDFPDERREWWSRSSAWVAIYSLGWMALFALALYSPLVAQWMVNWVRGALTLGWLAQTIYGTLQARSVKTGGGGPTDRTGFMIKTAPPVFAIGLLALLSFFIYSVSPHERPRAHHEAVAVKMNLDLRQDSPDKSAAISASVNSGSVNEKLSYHDRAEAYWPSVWCDPTGHSFPACPKDEHRKPISLGWTALLIAACAGAAALLSWRVDINEFSMHLLYRNRLARCYLGASHQGEKHERNPDPFTGFDSDDDILLARFAQDVPLKPNENKYVGAYPILNATLNVTHGKRLAWQERKAESFVFTPRYCGFDVKPDWQPRVKGKKKPLEDAGYRPTCEYIYSEEEHCPGGPYLGTAMGISGAAMSPNMGFHTNPALAFLMTVFDLRLGWWAGNPRHQGGWWTRGSRNKPSWRKAAPPWKRRGPGLGMLYLLLELFGLTDDEAPYVYLSDGGHFEDLGIYELVRRRCKLIVACDASEDREYKFEALGNAIRKCRDDFGVDITINVGNLRAVGKSGQNGDDEIKKSKQHCAVGIISYDNVWPNATPGILIYIKASLTGDESTDVLEYKNSHTDFPHDSTADQWFSESQFESYRKLGEHIIEQCASLDHTLRQGTSVCELLETDEWGHLRTTKDLDAYLARELGGVYQP
jgi:hypothetical protein